MGFITVTFVRKLVMSQNSFRFDPLQEKKHLYYLLFFNTQLWDLNLCENETLN